jgi:hypothetical protein
MPMIYTSSLTTAGVLTTNASANTETDTWFLKAGTRNAALQSVYVLGRGAGLTTISGITFRIIKWTTASTGGTAITPTPKDPGMQAATATAASRPTAGATRVNRLSFGCGAAGPGGWVAPNPDSVELLAGGGALSIDSEDVSGTVSLNFEFSLEHIE